MSSPYYKRKEVTNLMKRLLNKCKVFIVILLLLTYTTPYAALADEIVGDDLQFVNLPAQPLYAMKAKDIPGYSCITVCTVGSDTYPCVIKFDGNECTTNLKKCTGIADNPELLDACGYDKNGNLKKAIVYYLGFDQEQCRLYVKGNTIYALDIISDSDVQQTTIVSYTKYDSSLTPISVTATYNEFVNDIGNATDPNNIGQLVKCVESWNLGDPKECTNVRTVNDGDNKTEHEDKWTGNEKKISDVQFSEIAGHYPEYTPRVHYNGEPSFYYVWDTIANIKDKKSRFKRQVYDYQTTGNDPAFGTGTCKLIVFNKSVKVYYQHPKDDKSTAKEEPWGLVEEDGNNVYVFKFQDDGKSTGWEIETIHPQDWLVWKDRTQGVDGTYWVSENPHETVHRGASGLDKGGYIGIMSETVTDFTDEAKITEVFEKEIEKTTKFTEFCIDSTMSAFDSPKTETVTKYTQDNKELTVKRVIFPPGTEYYVHDTHLIARYFTKTNEGEEAKLYALSTKAVSANTKVDTPLATNGTYNTLPKDFLPSDIALQSIFNDKHISGVEDKPEIQYLTALSRIAGGHSYDSPLSVNDSTLQEFVVGADNIKLDTSVPWGNINGNSELDVYKEVTTAIYGNYENADETSGEYVRFQGWLLQLYPLIPGHGVITKDKAMGLIKQDSAKDKFFGTNKIDVIPNYDIITAENEHTSSSSLFDYAFTNYSRLAYYTSLANSADNIDRPSNLSTFYGNNSILGIPGPVVFSDEDSTPIMITKGSGSLYEGGYVKDSITADELGALNRTVMEWGSFATVWSKDLNAYYDEHGALATNDKKCLEHLHQAVEDYGTLYPAIAIAWKAVYNGKSLEELYNLESEEGENDGLDYLSSTRVSPLDMFFTISVVGLDPNSIGANDPWSWFSGTKSSTSVILSEYMKKGISYSASYVPLQTNVYAEDQINLMMESDEDFVKNFHYKYGFQRKALKLAKSATAVTDFYNTKGTKLSTTTTCTLQDLLDAAKTDQEVMLYIDDNFYNYDNLEEAVKPRATLQANTINTAADYSMEVNQNVNGTDPNKADADAGTSKQTNEYSLDTTVTTGTDADKVMQSFLDVTKLGNVMALTTDDFITLTQLLTQLKGTEIRLDEKAVRHGSGYTQYDTTLRNQINEVDSTYLVGGNYVDVNVAGSSGYTTSEGADLESDDTALNGSRTLDKNNPDNYVFSSFDIADVLDGKTARVEEGQTDDDVLYEYESYDTYTPALSYAYISAIYRDDQAFTLLQDSTYYSPVFMASESLPAKVEQDPEIHARLQDCIFNYALLHNLDSMAQVTYTYSLDLQAPIYMDIYGNILTASGIVIIPAAANATLWGEAWAASQPAIGLYTCYGNNYYIPYTVQTPQLTNTFEGDVDEKYWVVLNRSSVEPVEDDAGDTSISAPLLNYANLDEYNTDSQLIAVQNMSSFLGSNANINWWAYVGIISEVMRGAPIENIDIVKEDLTNKNLNAEGIVLAAKLESLEDSLEDSMQQNNLLVIPDFTRLDHIEYVLAFIIKTMAIITVAMVIVLVYRDGAAGTIGFGTLFRTLGAVFLTFTTITVIPAIFNFTYYGANKFLLQKEAERIAMFSTEKYESGLEVGVTDTSVPTNDNDLMVQLDWVDIPWYDHLQNMMFGQSIMGLKDIRDRAYMSSLVANQPDVYQYNDGVYMTVSDIFDSASIDYSYSSMVYNGATLSGNEVQTDKNLYLRNNSDTQTLSYYSPYYVFLKALVHNVNDYNAKNGTYKYTTKYMSGSRLKTVGLSTQYFKSPYFMEDCSDIFHLYNVFEEAPPVQEYDYDLFSAEDTAKMGESLWYTNYADEPKTYDRIQKMNEYARDFIADNGDLLDKISDETFIKVMALSCAMKFNQIYGVSEANCYEIYNIDSNDLLRLCVCKSDDAMLASPMSYSRYLYTYGGELAVYAGAALDMIMWIGSFIKPLCTILCFISIFMSIFVFKVLLRRSGGLSGYFITAGLLSATNILHALILKFSTLLPDFHLPPAACVIIIALGQVAYMLLLANVTAIALRDWSDLGSAYYKSTSMWVKNTMRGDTVQAYNSNVPQHEDNWQYYKDMQETYRQRN